MEKKVSRIIASVVICTYNRANLLRRLLHALPGQTLPASRYEIIVVDDGSSDETPSVCRQFLPLFPNMTYVRNDKKNGLAKARNAGIRAASADHILWTDDDCIPEKNWIEATCAALESHPIVAGAVASPPLSYLQVCHNVSEFHTFMPGRKERYDRFIAGANMAFHRNVLEKLGGFNERMPCAEDTELIFRARLKRYDIFFEPASIVMHHHARKHFVEIFSYSVYHGSITIGLRNRYRQLMRTPFILRSPALLILCAPLIALINAMGIYLRNSHMVRYLNTAPVVYVLKLAWCWGAARGLSSEKRGEWSTDEH